MTARQLASPACTCSHQPAIRESVWRPSHAAAVAAVLCVAAELSCKPSTPTEARSNTARRIRAHMFALPQLLLVRPCSPGSLGRGCTWTMTWHWVNQQRPWQQHRQSWQHRRAQMRAGVRGRASRSG